jgi:hypothetical protein
MGKLYSMECIGPTVLSGGGYMQNCIIVVLRRFT